MTLWHRLSACAFVLLLLASCASAPTSTSLKRHEFSRVIMGVQARIVLYAYSRDAAFAGAQAAFARLEQLDGILSDYRPSSELMQLCASPHNIPHTISPHLYAVLRTSLEIAEATDGAFDPTLGPLTKLWREARRAKALPTTDAINSARAHAGFRHLLLAPLPSRKGLGEGSSANGNNSTPTATLLLPNMLLDLGGVAKGYAAAEARDTLRAHNLPICLVALAGDIALGDPPPNEPGWRIDLFSPSQMGARAGGWARETPGLKPPHQTSQTLLLSNTSISTSGPTEQFLEIHDVRYSHILNPATGLGVTHNLTITVVGPDSAAVDALSSAICVLAPATPEAILPLLRPGMACLILDPVRTSPSPAPNIAPGKPLPIDPENLLRWAPAATFEPTTAPETME